MLETAADQRASTRAVALAATVALVAHLAAWLRLESGATTSLLAVPVVYTLAVVAALLLAHLLAGRARIVANDAHRWLSAGFLVTGGLVLAQGIAVAAAVRGPVVTPIDGAVGLYLLSQAAMPVFVAGALVVPRRARWRWGVAAGFALALVVAVRAPAPLDLPRLVDPAGSVTPLVPGLLAGLLLAQVAALAGWLWRTGARASRTELWIGVGLLLMVLDLAVAMGSSRLPEAAWWSWAVLRIAQFAVPAVGLLADDRRLLRLLHHHEGRLEEQFGEELRPTAPSAAAVPSLGRDRLVDILGAQRFSPVFQPIWSLTTGEVVALEALVRFDFDPAAPPDRVLAGAGRLGLRVELELSVTARALATAAGLAAPIEVSVNVSPDTVVDDRFAALVEDHPRLIVEVTEHDVVEDYGRLREALEGLRAGGCRIAIDDAGAGFSTLRHIVRLEPDLIKLDRSLTRDVDADPMRRALARCLVDFADETGTVLVAEGVERIDELLALQELGAHAVQGYLLGRPVPLSDAAPAGDTLPAAVRAALHPHPVGRS
ncbi:EAL domain-containing protein [Egicoccus halophilus]|uniref:EAL domain-containing protein n=1 Tax=Egicoccus halophilus TaxID=1670830 RepID=A0A8J3EQY2_9ACTN|nr:EAL domain-containing protein [Egicoccus halophilus]GGI03683.1 hypothetical protein GCM10011354_05260 [Egicoccus halophilus]